jgi:hypothetical protein
MNSQNARPIVVGVDGDPGSAERFGTPSTKPAAGTPSCGSCTSCRSSAWDPPSP